MRRDKGRRARRTGELLELWMGEPAEERARPPRLSGQALAAVLAVASLATIGLAKYAVDVLLIGAALAGTGLLLHVLGTWLAESDLLSPGWFTILILTAALGAWTFLYPTEGLEGLGRYVPKPVAKFFEWSESKGWGQRVLVGPGGGGAPPSGQAGGAPAPAARRDEASSPPSRSLTAAVERAGANGRLTLSVSQTRARPGEAVGLTARVVGNGSASGTVRFYDGTTPIGQARIVRDASAWVAYLTVSLGPGEHRITAEWNGTKAEGVGIRVR